MEAIILTGGLGTRLQSIVKKAPKPMADIQGRPFLSYVMDYLSNQGVQRALLSVGYMHEVIQRYFGSRYGLLSIGYVIEHEPLGTGGAIREAMQSTCEEDVIVLNGDTFFAVDLNVMMKFHRQKNADITIALKPMYNAERYGAVIMGQDNRITGFKEKSLQGGGHINGGLYVVKRRLTGMLQGFGGNFSFENDFLHKHIDHLAAYAFVNDDYFIDIGIPVDYKKAQETLARAVEERIS